MVTLNGEPLVGESAARLDLATEYGILFANFRNTSLENAVLTHALQAVNIELAQAQQSCATMSEKYRELSLNRDEVARQLRGHVVKTKKTKRG